MYHFSSQNKGEAVNHAVQGVHHLVPRSNAAMQKTYGKQNIYKKEKVERKIRTETLTRCRTGTSNNKSVSQALSAKR